jgi:hypothetical protein
MNILTIIALLIQLGFLQSEPQWYELTPGQQQQMQEYVITNEVLMRIMG